MRSLIIGAILWVLVSPAVQAADFIAYPTSAAGQMPVADTPKYDWDGFYAGVFGAYQHGKSGGGGGDRLGLGIDAGVDTTFNFVLAGAEVAVQGLSGANGGTTYAQLTGRTGLLLGDNALLYGAAGYGLDTGPSDESDLLAGGGLEYALPGGVSLRAQYLHGFPITGDNAKDQVTLGAQFHF
jgi:outer membrane immunogenic protein